MDDVATSISADIGKTLQGAVGESSKLTVQKRDGSIFEVVLERANLGSNSSLIHLNGNVEEDDEDFEQRLRDVRMKLVKSQQGRDFSNGPLPSSNNRVVQLEIRNMELSNEVSQLKAQLLDRKDSVISLPLRSL